MTWDELPERFRSKVRVGGPNDCWEWQAARLVDGYGQFKFKSPSATAHRYVFARMIGPIPAGLFICHHCDNPPCVNPKHLFLGTSAENIRDSRAKDRIQWKLRASQAEMIRCLYVEMEVTQAYLAKVYGVTQSAVSQIFTRTIWQADRSVG